MITCVLKCVKTKVSVVGCLYFLEFTATLQLLGVTAKNLTVFVRPSRTPHNNQKGKKIVKKMSYHWF